MFNYQKFKELRKKKKLSVEDIAANIGISSGTIYHYQAGRLEPSQEVLEKIAKLLDIDLLELQQNSNEDKTPWKDEAYNRLKLENEKLWLLVQKLTGAQVADLGKLTASIFTTKETKIVPLYTSVTKQIA